MVIRELVVGRWVGFDGRFHGVLGRWTSWRYMKLIMQKVHHEFLIYSIRF